MEWLSRMLLLLLPLQGRSLLYARTWWNVQMTDATCQVTYLPWWAAVVALETVRAVVRPYLLVETKKSGAKQKRMLLMLLMMSPLIDDGEQRQM